MKIFLINTFVMFLFCINISAQFSGNALQFDGIDDYVDLGISAVFNIDSAFTYEAWVKPDTELNGFIFNKWVNFQEDKQLTYSGGRFTFYLFNAFSGASLVTASIIPLHQYTHIAATYDGSEAKLYVNGVLDTSKVVGGTISNSSGNLYIGHNPNRFDVNAPFKGIIDEFRTWNIARTESEIQSTMNQSLNGNETGLVGYWKFDEGAGLTTADQTSNGNSGTIGGALWVPGTTSVNDEINIPESFNLYQNFPNPFNPTTTIQYSIPQRSNVTLKVYDVLGNEMATLVNEEKERGMYTINFDALPFATGIYLYRMKAGSFARTNKMILIK
jgi:hypothetical protein